MKSELEEILIVLCEKYGASAVHEKVEEILLANDPYYFDSFTSCR